MFYGPEYSDSLVSAPRTAPLSSELSSDFDVRDPVLAVLLDVQRGRIGALTALACLPPSILITPESEARS